MTSILIDFALCCGLLVAAALLRATKLAWLFDGSVSTAKGKRLLARRGLGGLAGVRVHIALQFASAVVGGHALWRAWTSGLLFP